MFKAIAKKKLFLIATFLLFFTVLLLPIGKAVPSNINVLYIGINHSDWKDRPVKAAIELEKTFNLTSIETDNAFLSSDISDIKVVVLQDIVLSNQSIQKLKAWIEKEGFDF